MGLTNQLYDREFSYLQHSLTSSSKFECGGQFCAIAVARDKSDNRRRRRRHAIFLLSTPFNCASSKTPGPGRIWRSRSVRDLPGRWQFRGFCHGWQEVAGLENEKRSIFPSTSLISLFRPPEYLVTSYNIIGVPGPRPVTSPGYYRSRCLIRTTRDRYIPLFPLPRSSRFRRPVFFLV